MTLVEILEVAGAASLAVGFAGHTLVLAGKAFGSPKVERLGVFLEGLGTDWKKMISSVRAPVRAPDQKTPVSPEPPREP